MTSSAELKDKNGRGERIRTSDPLVPNQVRYQTALRPEKMCFEDVERLGAYRCFRHQGKRLRLASST